MVDDYCTAVSPENRTFLHVVSDRNIIVIGGSSLVGWLQG